MWTRGTRTVPRQPKLARQILDQRFHHEVIQWGNGPVADWLSMGGSRLHVEVCKICIGDLDLSGPGTDQSEFRF